MFDVIAFDADDTLWHTETLFQETQAGLVHILSRYAPRETIIEKLYATERENIKLFGYGVKGFTLSMIQTSIQLSHQKISAQDILAILELGRHMLQAPLTLMEGIRPVLRRLTVRHDLMVITKGDLMDQTNKVEQSNLEHLFEHIEVLSEKNPQDYQVVLKKYDINPNRFLMVGNSMKSDILPILELGGFAAYIPYEITAEIEKTDKNPSHPRLFRLDKVTQLPELIKHIEETQKPLLYQATNSRG